VSAAGVLLTGYHATRFAEAKKRAVLWRTLWRVCFSRLVGPQDAVLDLGAGYGSFINEVKARRRVALDQWPGVLDHLAPGVEGVVAAATDLSALADASIDVVFASNLFEHLTKEDFAASLREIRRVLAPRGRLIIVQPNYAYAYREYFDDYTHVSVWTHVSLADFLTANGFAIEDLRARFLPLTIKSRLPVSPLLIAAYLKSPWKPLAKQMLVAARKAD
jgi:SAM-dependent methyltransferase